MSHRYLLFGLVLDSDIELPELIKARGKPDVAIRLADLGDELPRGAGLHRLGPDDALLCIEEAGRYRCRDGSELLVEPLSGVPERNLRLFLLGSAMGLLLHQRGLLPLHANAVEVDGTAIAFLGHSGAGKSTLAAWFLDGGHRVIADDVAAVSFDARGAPLVSPGPPRLRLWREALDRSGRNSSDYLLSYAGDEQFEKYDVPAAGVGADAAVLGAIVLLDRGQASSVERLTGAEAVGQLVANIYRGELLGEGQHEALWRSCVQLAQRVPVWRWRRRWGHHQFGDEVRTLLGTVGPMARTR